MRVIDAAVLFLGIALAQRGTVPDTNQPAPPGISLPNAAERAKIAAENHKKNVDQADQLLRLAMELKADLNQESSSVYPARTVKDAREIKKLADSILKRLKSN